MFASTTFGAQICPAHSLMIPCLHDEGYARLQIHQQTIPRVRALLFYAQAEQALADRLFPAQNGQMRTVIGGGVDTDWQGDGRRFRQKYGLGDTPFVLYAGRREAGKNTPLLLDYWAQYVAQTSPPVRLVLLGPGQVTVPAAARDHVLDLGFVPTQDKYDAYAAADLFCMPSVHESFSIVIMESWLAGTPVLVHGECAVTREHCVQANGGLYFTNYREFAATVDYLLANRETAVTLGQQGRQYVLKNYQWDAVIDRYTAVIQTIMNEEALID
jgi:glycosyltransferase involved in cell wall biosynthesis